MNWYKTSEYTHPLFDFNKHEEEETISPDRLEVLRTVYKFQSKMHMSPYASDLQEDFIIKAILGGFSKQEIIEGLKEIFRISYGEEKINKTLDKFKRYKKKDAT